MHTRSKKKKKTKIITGPIFPSKVWGASRMLLEAAFLNQRLFEGSQNMPPKDWRKFEKRIFLFTKSVVKTSIQYEKARMRYSLVKVDSARVTLLKMIYEQTVSGEIAAATSQQSLIRELYGAIYSPDQLKLLFATREQIEAEGGSLKCAEDRIGLVQDRGQITITKRRLEPGNRVGSLPKRSTLHSAVRRAIFGNSKEYSPWEGIALQRLLQDK